MAWSVNDSPTISSWPLRETADTRRILRGCFYEVQGTEAFPVLRTSRCEQRGDSFNVVVGFYWFAHWIYEGVGILGTRLEFPSSIETGSGPVKVRRRMSSSPYSLMPFLSRDLQRVISCCDCCVHDASEHCGSLGSWWDDDA